MTEKEIQTYGEIQYLKGRLDELHKAISNVTNMQKSRILDQRIEKYYTKLKNVSELAYHLYQVEMTSRARSKKKSQENIKDLLTLVLHQEELTEDTRALLQNQVLKYE